MLRKKVDHEKARKILSPVSPYAYFKLHEGRELRGLHDLEEAISSMPEHIFYHHVTGQRNDFANWVKDILGDVELAKKMVKVTGRNKLRSILQKRIQELEKDATKVPKVKPQPVVKQKAALKAPAMQQSVPEPRLARIESELKSIEHREREIQLREQKILEIEKRIEQKLQSNVMPHQHKFLTREFVQGFFVGILVFLVGLLLYIRFLR